MATVREWAAVAPAEIPSTCRKENALVSSASGGMSGDIEVFEQDAGAIGIAMRPCCGLPQVAGTEGRNRMRRRLQEYLESIP